MSHTHTDTVLICILICINVATVESASPDHFHCARLVPSEVTVNTAIAASEQGKSLKIPGQMGGAA